MHKKTISELIDEVGGNIAFSEYFDVPMKTVEGWKSGKKCRQYNVRAYERLWKLRSFSGWFRVPKKDANGRFFVGRNRGKSLKNTQKIPKTEEEK